MSEDAERKRNAAIINRWLLAFFRDFSVVKAYKVILTISWVIPFFVLFWLNHISYSYCQWRFRCWYLRIGASKPLRIFYCLHDENGDNVFLLSCLIFFFKFFKSLFYFIYSLTRADLNSWKKKDQVALHHDATFA